MKYKLRIGTRGSPLALAQTKQIFAALEKARPNLDLEIKIISTTGDDWSAQNEPTLPVDKGMFIKELEEALLRHEIDVAVHSLKDMPTDGHGQLMISAIPPREEAGDVLISRYDLPFQNLPPSAKVATGSVRRTAQIKQARPDLQIIDIRGNIDTRLHKLRENTSWHGIILAAAGLARLKPDLTDLHVLPLPFDIMLPAPGQGALALQTRETDQIASTSVVCLHDYDTMAVVQAERAFLQALGGGCSSPIGAYAEFRGEELRLHGIYFPEPGQPPRSGDLLGSPYEAEELGRQLALLLKK